MHITELVCRIFGLHTHADIGRPQLRRDRVLSRPAARAHGTGGEGAERRRCRVVISPNHETRAPSSADATGAGGRGRGGANIGEAGDADTAAIKPVIWPNTERRDEDRNAPARHATHTHTQHLAFLPFLRLESGRSDDTVTIERDNDSGCTGSS